MGIGRLLTASALFAFGILSAKAEIPATIRLGVLNDMSGPYSDNSGKGSVAATRMAVDEFLAAHPGVKVEILSADHQNKADVASAIARQWVSVEKVDAIVDVPNSAAALAVNEAVRGTHTAFVASSAATSDLTGKFCSPNTVQWTFDTWAVAQTLAKALADQGHKTWYAIATDNALGKSMIASTQSALGGIAGSLVGSSYTPLNSGDYSPPLLQASASGADVIAFATAGGDTVTLIKQSAEFGLRKPGKSFAAMLATTNDVRAAGLDAAQGVLLVQPFYPDIDAPSRAWADRYEAREHGDLPTAFHAGVYSSVKAYLEAVARSRSTDGATVVREIKRQPIHDDAFGDVQVRADGRAVHAMYLFRVKTPAESKWPNDLLERIGALNGTEAFRPLADGGCPLLDAMMR